MAPLHKDPERLQAFRRGDREVLASLYREHGEAVEKLLMHGFTFNSQGQAMRFGGFKDQPYRLQEAIQESFLKAFSASARQRYDGTSPWRPYLVRIARNQTLDLLRRMSLEARYVVPISHLGQGEDGEDDPLSRIADEQGVSPEVTAMRRQLGEVLASFLAELEPEQRRLIQEHLVGDVAQRQMAESMGISRNDLRKEIAQLRGQLLRRLKEAGVIDSMDASTLFNQMNQMLVCLSLCAQGVT